MVKPPRILLFDLDQTLLASSRRLRFAFVFSFVRVFISAGIPILKVIPLLKRLRMALETAEPTQSNELRAQKIALEYGLSEKTFHDLIVKVFREVLHHFTPMKESLQCFHELKSRYPVVLATNPMWPAEVLQLRLNLTGLKFSDFILVTHAGNMNHSKREVGYYNQLMQQLGAKPEECLMIGDSLEKDAIATEANIPVFLLRPEFKRVNELLTEGTVSDLRLILSPPEVDAVVVNQMSQGGRAIKKWNRIKNYFPQTPRFIIRSPSDHDNLAQWLIEMNRSGKTRLLAVGGDGTAGWVLHLIFNLKLPFTLGMMGLGSSNDYQKPISHPRKRFFAGYPIRSEFRDAMPIDVMEITWRNQAGVFKRYSALNGSIGTTALGNELFNRENSWISFLKRFSVSLAILGAAVKSFFEFKPITLEVSIDDESSEEMKIVNFSFFKNRHFSGDFRYDFEPGLDSGRLGLAWVQSQSKFKLLKTMVKLLQGKYSEEPGNSWRIAKKLKIRARSEFLIEIDGEVYRANEFEVIIPKEKLKVCT